MAEIAFLLLWTTSNNRKNKLHTVYPDDEIFVPLEAYAKQRSVAQKIFFIKEVTNLLLIQIVLITSPESHKFTHGI